MAPHSDTSQHSRKGLDPLPGAGQAADSCLVLIGCAEGDVALGEGRDATDGNNDCQKHVFGLGRSVQLSAR
jgi:hypothetical protein